MENVVNVQWIKGMAFKAEIEGHKIILDSSPEYGGEDLGPKPKPFMLVALAGCTAMDVVSLLKKMKIKFEYFNVKVEGSLTEKHPKHYEKMKVIYEFRGKEMERKKIEKAINLSLNKYCGVSAFYKKVLDIPTEIRILD